LVYTNAQFGTAGILYGKGDGTFYDPVEFASGGWAFGVALADVNGDGVTDLLNNSGNTTALASSNTSPYAGELVTYTATVTPTVRGVTTVPTGTVTFYDGSTPFSSTALNDGVAALNTWLTAGAHSITAQFNPTQDSQGGYLNFISTTSPVVKEAVSQATDSAVVSSSANPAALEQPVTFTATVSGPSGDEFTPSGTVTFYDTFGGVKTALGSPGLNSSGVAIFSTSGLAVGTHSITAQYVGDANFLGSASSALNQVV